MKQFEVTIRARGKIVDDFIAAKTVAVQIITEHIDLIKDGDVLEIEVNKHDKYEGNA